MSKEFCIVVFSHADTTEKEEILFNSLSSIKKLNLKIILASHIPVSERNQKLTDYFIKDDNNFIITEADLFNNPSELFDTYYTTDIFGGCRFETSVYKKSYQAGVFNLYIGAFKFAKQLGFKNVILWEYDYFLGDKSVEFMNQSIDKMSKDNLESISFFSMIKIFNCDIVQREIGCCYAIPAFFNLDRFLSIAPDKFIETPKEYTSVSKLMIMEQWVKENIINNCNPKIEYNHGDYSYFLPDTKVGQVHSQGSNYLFLGLRSGIYFSDNKKCMTSYNNISNNHLKINLIIFDNSDNSILFQENSEINPGSWKYNYLSNEIFNMFITDSGCRVVEKVTDINSNKTDIFDYIINKNNIDFVSKLKKFSNI